ncbi:hypothetical protein PILCRDRAFT_2554 [Piloderma croceum F 1598]|uniref:Uncharacterized protein n=1 Tax=Piloderma croceum (strain F 1598) TaxID=765440 RepID=A0A0C3FYP5_PILCF|nr:hypothetical protein PILCRDRAFT_2554 [Piloderma croceum F 1598]
MKSLGEKAYSAAKPRVGPDQGTHVPSLSSVSSLSNFFSSRGALLLQVQTVVMSYPDSQHPAEPTPTVALHDTSPLKIVSGHHIKVLDLGPLMDLPSLPPNTISKFTVSKWQLISNIEFTRDGNLLIISTQDGKVIQVYQLRPILSVLKGDPVALTDDARHVAAEPWHVYSLRRGRTSAVIDSIGVSKDGQWIAQPLSTDVIPLVQLRFTKSLLPEHSTAPLSFTFITSSKSSLPASLLPAATLAISTRL